MASSKRSKGRYVKGATWREAVALAGFCKPQPEGSQ